MQVTWESIKTISQSKLVGLIHIEEDNRYIITLNEIGTLFFCLLNKNDPKSAEQLDFETNFKALSNKPQALSIESQPFSSAGGFRFRGASFKTAVATGTTKDFDYALTEERWINGGRLIVDNVGTEDAVTFQVVDKDNLFGLGEGVILDEFIENFYVPDNGDLEVALAYPARLISGLFLRLKYTSTHPSGCTVKCNLYLHKKS